MSKLNIGCGRRTLPGYVNADINGNLPNIDMVCELYSIPAEENLFEEVFASHCIEHVPIRLAQTALKEWYRVLQPGGLLIVDTPNIERNASMYLNGTWMNEFLRLPSQEQELCKLNGVPNKTLWLNFKIISSEHQYDTHYWNADGDLLLAFVKEAGFSSAQITQRDPSLIIRAVK